MVRPEKYRWIEKEPEVVFYKPAGVPLAFLKEITLKIDEFQTIILADGRGLYQSEGAKLMGVSRQTFARILKSGRKKLADALSEGYAIRIEGGKVIKIRDEVECKECGHIWYVDMPYQTISKHCPKCENSEMKSLEKR